MSIIYDKIDFKMALEYNHFKRMEVILWTEF